MFHILIREDRDPSINHLEKVTRRLVDKNPKLEPLIVHYLNQQLGNLTPQSLEEILDSVHKDHKSAVMALRALGENVYLKLTEVQQAQELFATKYIVQDASEEEQALAFTDVKILGDDLQKDVDNAGDRRKVAYKFYHRFDVPAKTWFLTAHRHQLKGTGIFGKFTNITPEAKDNELFDITAGGLRAPSVPGGLADIPGSNTKRDENYLDNVASTEGYDKDNRVWGFVLPEKELRLVIDHNLLEGASKDFTLNFRCVSYEIPYDPTKPLRSLVPFPHCVVVYAGDATDPVKIEDAAVIVGAEFREKAANMETLCPPNCTRYFWPTGLPA